MAAAQQFPKGLLAARAHLGIPHRHSKIAQVRTHWPTVPTRASGTRCLNAPPEQASRQPESGYPAVAPTAAI